MVILPNLSALHFNYATDLKSDILPAIQHDIRARLTMILSELNHEANKKIGAEVLIDLQPDLWIQFPIGFSNLEIYTCPRQRTVLLNPTQNLTPPNLIALCLSTLF